MISITIIVPAYNEEKRIGKTLRTISNYLGNNYDYEIIIVDDGSTDSTTQIVKNFSDSRIKLICGENNRGKGFAVKTGMLAAQKYWVLFTDADLSTPIEELDKLLKFQNKDIVIGSRALPEAKVSNQLWYREWGGKLFNFLVRLLVLPDFKDTQCGFKLFKKSAAQSIFRLQTIENFGFDVEILYLAKKFGFAVQEVPVQWRNDRKTKVNFVKDALRMVIDLIKIRINDKKGIYTELGE